MESTDETAKDPATEVKKDPKKQASFYLTEIGRAKKKRDQWLRRSEKIVKAYRNEEETGGSKFNVLWSNVQILKPALYSRTPKTVVERRNKTKDDIGRDSGTILERAENLNVAMQDFDSTMEDCVLDFLLPGAALIWNRYEAELSDDGEDLKDERVCADYVYWQDWLCSPVRRWSDVRWVARLSYLYEDEAKEQFGNAANILKYDYTPVGLDKDKVSAEHQQACVWEVWDKKTKTVCFVADETPSFYVEKERPYKLRNFFPCGRPIIFGRTTDTLIPVPWYFQWQDLAAHLSVLVDRANGLADALRVAGAYPEEMSDLQKLLTSNSRNKLIPVKNYTGFLANGKMADAITWLPMEQVAKVLISTYEAVDKTLARIYELTGMSDIVRGLSNPNETATAQQIKGNFATLRISDLQKEIQRFARDNIAIQAEIIAEKFDPITLRAMVGDDILPDRQPQVDPQTGQPGMPIPPEQQPFMQAVALLRSDLIRTYKIDVETDSTIAVDEQREKAEVSEFMSAFPQFAQVADQMSQDPAFAQVMGELLLACVRRFRFGRGVEAGLEAAIDQKQQQMEQQASQPPQPDPAQQELQLKQQEMQVKMQGEQAKLQLSTQEAQARIQLEQEKIAQADRVAQIQAQTDLKKHEMTLAMDYQKSQADAALKLQELQSTMVLKAEETNQRMQLEAAKVANVRENMQTQAAIKAVQQVNSFESEKESE